MDDTDLQILRCLKENGRANATAIGGRVNLSTSSVIERIRRMEATGIIERYTVVVDHKRIGKDITAFISVNLEHPKYNRAFRERICACADVAECHYLAGDYDYLLKVVTGNSDSLERVLNDIKGIGGVSRTRTLVVLTTVKSDVSILPQSL